MAVFLASTVGCLFSFVVLALLRPALPVLWRWAGQGMALHAGLWLMVDSLLVMILGRPWFSMAITLAFLMLLVQVNNAKYHSLREAFVFQDFEYFTDAIRHPRLYIPFLGWWKFAMIVVMVLAALGIGLWLETAPAERFALNGQLGEAVFIFVFGALLIGFAPRGPVLVFVPGEDMRQLGFLACLWRYGWAERTPMKLPALLPKLPERASERPDLLVVQSESFFDPRSLYPGIRPEVLAEFDQLNSEALSHGRLRVPAWGANTVRSEFAFLSGATEVMLGVHRFNPYRQILKAEVNTLATVLKAAGYRTVCVHPYPASFYGRDKVFPHLGFDEFIDIRSFTEAPHFGPYIADLALAERVKALIGSTNGPIFVFVITMENHGPLHLEKHGSADVAAAYSKNPPENCEDLTVYLRHLKNADQMIGNLRLFLKQHPRPARLCWYGDHVPIMADAYRQLGDPDGLTEYCIWSNLSATGSPKTTMKLNSLASQLLHTML